ncbi:MAG TPA: phosphoglycerate mutase family protein [Acidimicrobiia bacterium]|nr:phosphoglycerate mutase family protein [Acidimicrobiia bacterium]
MSETPVFLVRHAKAGSRSRWDGADRDRPLSKAGRQQANGLAKLLFDPRITRIVTSPYLRCHQTVAPLGRRLDVPVETSDLLSEGTMLRDALRVVEKMSDRPTVLCTHGDVVGELLDHLERAGVLGVEARLEKGSTWVLGTEAGEVVSARYLPPPG